eukprot:372454-Amphidinium_carterae.1
MAAEGWEKELSCFEERLSEHVRVGLGLGREDMLRNVGGWRRRAFCFDRWRSGPRRLRVVEGARTHCGPIATKVCHRTFIWVI